MRPAPSILLHPICRSNSLFYPVTLLFVDTLQVREMELVLSTMFTGMGSPHMGRHPGVAAPSSASAGSVFGGFGRARATASNGSAGDDLDDLEVVAVVSEHERGLSAFTNEKAKSCDLLAEPTHDDYDDDGKQPSPGLMASLNVADARTESHSVAVTLRHNGPAQIGVSMAEAQHSNPSRHDVAPELTLRVPPQGSNAMHRPDLTATLVHAQRAPDADDTLRTVHEQTPSTKPVTEAALVEQREKDARRNEETAEWGVSQRDPPETASQDVGVQPEALATTMRRGRLSTSNATECVHNNQARQRSFSCPLCRIWRFRRRSGGEEDSLCVG